jgi:hypothetical protein
MSQKPTYQVVLLPSVNHTLKAEKLLKGQCIPCKLIPVPRHISSDCGICLRITPEVRQAVADALQEMADLIVIHDL